MWLNSNEPDSIHEDMGLTPGPAQWALLCRLQMWLRSGVAVALEGSYSSKSTPCLGTSLCHGFGLKSKKQKKQKKQKKTKTKTKKALRVDFGFPIHFNKPIPTQSLDITAQSAEGSGKKPIKTEINKPFLSVGR